MIEMGLCVALGLLIVMVKLPWRLKIALVSNPVLVDISVFALLTALHWGTFSGVMVATIGALACSVVLSIARKCIGHVRGGMYIRGAFDVSEKLR